MPVLAAEIPTLQNGGLAKDGRTVTWRLKKGVAWHDGKPFTADDVVFTWEYAADPATAAVSLKTYADVQRVERLDDHTVKVVFKEPRAFWYDAFFGVRGAIVPRHLFAPYKGANSRSTNGAMRQPPGRPRTRGRGTRPTSPPARASSPR